MFCHKCGHELPEDSKFCPKCGTAQPDGTGTTQEPKYEQSSKEGSKYKIDTTGRTGLLYDPYRNDPRFKAMAIYVYSKLAAATVSVFIMLGLCMRGETLMNIYYDYIYTSRHHLATWEFVGPAVIWSLICFATAIIVSYIQLKKCFYSSRAATAIIVYGKLEVGELKFTNIDDDIEFVSYFMKKYGRISKGAWILPVVFIVLIVFIIPRMM